jgi:RND family efflux transporter MFP subunit
MKTNIRAQAILAAALAALLSSCSESREVKAARPQSTQPVAVAKVVREDLTHDLELAAEFRPYQEIDVHAKVSGYLKAIYVDVGDRVRQGQLLAELEVPEMNEDLAQAAVGIKRNQSDVQRAMGEVSRAEASLKIREISYQRLQAVVERRPNLIAQQEIDDAAAKFREAEAQLATAKASLATTQEQVSLAQVGKTRVDTMMRYLRITAPFAGVITRRQGDSGALIQAGTASHTQAMPVVRLSQIDRLRLILPAPESIASRIRVGAPVEIRVESMNRILQGKVSRFAGKLDASTRTMETEVDIPNPDHSILPGMYGYATIRLDTKQDALAVPVQAVSRNGSAASVLRVDKHNRLESRAIETGLETPNLIEVVSGLNENDLVVVGNGNQVKPGAAVEPKVVDAADLRGGH